MMQDPSHRLATLLQAAHVSLEGVDDTLVRSDRLRGWAEALRARLRDRQGLNFARRRWAATLSGMQQVRQGLQTAVLRRKARLRRRILGMHLLRFWRRVRWWLLILVVAGLILLLVHYWPWISDLITNLRGPVLQPSPTPDLAPPRLPATGAGP